MVIDLGRDIRALAPGLIALRRALHQHPELAFDEVWTAGTLAARMRAVETERRSTEDLTFRVRVLQAEQRGQGGASQAGIEVHLGRGERSHAAIEINLAVHDNTLRTHLLGRIEEVAGAIVTAAGGTLVIEADYALPALVNDAPVTAALERAAQWVIGDANIIRGWRNRFSDDFASSWPPPRAASCCLAPRIPTRTSPRSGTRPGFDLDEDALPLGVEIMSLAALDLLR